MSASELATIEKDAQGILASLKSKSSLAEFDANMRSFKQAIIKLPNSFLAPGKSSTPQSLQQSVRFRTLAKNGFEEGLKFYAVLQSADDETLEKAHVEVKKYLKLLKGYYFDETLLAAGAFDGKPGASRMEIISLEMLLYLIEQHFSDFYCLLERLSFEDRENNKYVKFVKEIEEALMEGNYSFLLAKAASKEEGNSILFKRYIENLSDTIQKEVIDCVASAYIRIPEKEVIALLSTSASPKRGKGQVKLPEDWTIVDGKIFFSSKLDAMKRKPKIEKDNANDIISTNLNYAKELEKIV